MYKKAFNKCDSIHEKVFRKLRLPDYQKVVDECGLVFSGKNQIKMLLGQMYSHAMKLDTVKKDYSDGLDLGIAPEKSEKNILFEKQEITKMYKHVHLYRYVDTILMTIFAGLRPTELLEIETEKVFLNENYFICGIKTETGIDRKIPISRFTKPFFEKYYYEAKAAGSEHLILNTEGNQFTYGNYNRDKFHQLVSELSLNLDHVPYDGRHSFASFMNRVGANKLATQKILGHRPETLMERSYVILSLEELQENINMLENLFDLDKMLNSINPSYYNYAKEKSA